MIFKIEIDCDNAAFDDHCGIELSDILAKLARRLRKTQVDQTFTHALLDTNGNAVGRAVAYPA